MKANWTRIIAKPNGVTADWLLGALFGIGMGCAAGMIAAEYVAPSSVITLGVVVAAIAELLRMGIAWARGEFTPRDTPPRG